VPHQEALTLVAAVNPARQPELDSLMAKLGSDPAQNDVLPFGAVPGCHFARVLALPESRDLDGEPIGPELILLSDCDGSADAHLEQLVDVAGSGVDRLFSHCIGYPSVPAGRSERLAFLRRKRLRVKANYVHRPGRSVDQIKAEARLRSRLRELWSSHGPGASSALDARDRLIRVLRAQPDWVWALRAPEGVGVKRRIENALHAAAVPAAAAALAPVLTPGALLLLGLVRLLEARDRSEHLRPSADHMRALTTLEDRVAHSGFTAGGYVKAGVVRQIVMRSVLSLIGYGTRHLFTKDSLAGVKTIHFARWVPLDGGRRVVFASNFDGSVESYNNDFIDIVSWGLNLVFSNGHGYPRTRWLVLEGATREQEFKDYLRRHQIPTPVWYSAYPELTAANVARNSQLRRGLRGRMTEREAQKWLALL
jgi:hypothetical protein